MASGIEPRPISLTRIPKKYENVSGSANSNIYLTTNIEEDLGINSYEQIVSCILASDAGFGGAIWSLFLNTHSVYIKSANALSNATVNLTFWVI